MFPGSLYILLQSPRLPACANHIPFTTRFRSLLTKWRLSRVYNLQKGSNETGDTSKSRSDDSGTTGDGRGLRSRLASGRGNSGVGAVVGRAEKSTVSNDAPTVRNLICAKLTSRGR